MAVRRRDLGVARLGGRVLLLLVLLAGTAYARDVAVDVVVVGAGVSGLAAATKLKAAGLSVVVLEAQPRVGGRLLRTKAGAGNATAWIDLGGQWVGDTQTRALAYVKELGLKMFPTPHEPGKDVFIFNGKKSLSNYAFPYPPFDKAQLAKEWPDVKYSMAERDDLVNMVRKVEELSARIDPVAPWKSPNASLLDSMTIATWIEDNAKTDMGKYIVGALANVGGSGGFDTDEASMLHMAVTQRVSPQSEVPEGYLLDGGAAQIPLKLAEKLGPDRIKTSQPVYKISVDRAAKAVAVLTQPPNANRYTGKAVIVAMAPHLAGRIAYQPPMGPERDQLTQRFPMGTVIKVLVVYRTPFWRAIGLSGKGTGVLPKDGFINEIADSTNMVQKNAPGVLATFVTVDKAHEYNRLPFKERKQKVLANLAEFYGSQALDAIDYKEGNWPSVAYAGGAFTAFATPGTWTTLGAALYQPAHERIFWAGTEASTRWPGYIDGGIRAGEKAAEDAIKLLKK